MPEPSKYRMRVGDQFYDLQLNTESGVREVLRGIYPAKFMISSVIPGSLAPPGHEATYYAMIVEYRENPTHPKKRPFEIAIYVHENSFENAVLEAVATPFEMSENDNHG